MSLPEYTKQPDNDALHAAATELGIDFGMTGSAIIWVAKCVKQLDERLERLEKATAFVTGIQPIKRVEARAPEKD